uniref:Uncharacterized protein n=1 Tax=Ixodes ricinus TaxID=34613 RepID=A0A0K8RKB6_IXORI
MLVVLFLVLVEVNSVPWLEFVGRYPLQLNEKRTVPFNVLGRELKLVKIVAYFTRRSVRPYLIRKGVRVFFVLIKTKK